jgi:rubrerythrin
VRSRAAAQILTGSGFEQVYNLKGGIAAWQGQAAAGPEEVGMMLLKGDETPQDVIRLAYGLEEGLRKFYSTSAELGLEPEVVGLLSRLAEIEVKHKKRLFNLHLVIDNSAQDMETFETMINSEFIEGGFNTDKLLEQSRSAFKTAPGVLNFAMMLEAQAMDLYMRYCEKSNEPQVKEILFKMADEEKAHLKSLGNLLEKTMNN